MHAARTLRLLIVPAVLLAAACDDSSNPVAPEELPTADAEAPAPDAGRKDATGPLEDAAGWADGYIWAATVDGGLVPVSNASYNRSGGAITVTKVAGTTGRYVTRFKGLSALLGGKSTVHVSSSNTKSGAAYCKPVGGFLVRDSVEVRCFRAGTGAPMNSDFQLNVVGKRDDRAFAFANQPTAASYTLASAGTWNPAGATRVYRDGIGRYRVVFTGFGARLPATSGGHVQVNAVAVNKAHCKTKEWGSTTDLVVDVTCYTPAGVPADAKFTALVTPPAAHLAFVWADQPTLTSYNPHYFYSSNPVGGSVVITRAQVGSYHVRWIGVEAEIRDFGNAQVTAWGFDGTQCKLGYLDEDGVSVQCFGPNGAAADTWFSVLLSS